MHPLPFHDKTELLWGSHLMAASSYQEQRVTDPRCRFWLVTGKRYRPNERNERYSMSDAGKKGKRAEGIFFAIDNRLWERVCALGLNEAVAYLVQARGTGRDNRTTTWSVEAIE